MGPLAEQRSDARHFIELTSVFTADPVLSVRQGRYEIGQVPDVLSRPRTRSAAAGRSCCSPDDPG